MLPTVIQDIVLEYIDEFKRCEQDLNRHAYFIWEEFIYWHVFDINKLKMASHYAEDDIPEWTFEYAKTRPIILSCKFYEMYKQMGPPFQRDEPVMSYINPPPSSTSLDYDLHRDFMILKNSLIDPWYADTISPNVLLACECRLIVEDIMDTTHPHKLLETVFDIMIKRKNIDVRLKGCGPHKHWITWEEHDKMMEEEVAYCKYLVDLEGNGYGSPY